MAHRLREGRDDVAASGGTEEHLVLLRRMDEAGVRFTSGLDMGMPHAPHDGTAANAWAFVEWMGWSPWRLMSRLATSSIFAKNFNLS